MCLNLTFWFNFFKTWVLAQQLIKIWKEQSKISRGIKYAKYFSLFKNNLISCQVLLLLSKINANINQHNNTNIIKKIEYLKNAGHENFFTNIFSFKEDKSSTNLFCSIIKSIYWSSTLFSVILLFQIE